MDISVSMETDWLTSNIAMSYSLNEEVQFNSKIPHGKGENHKEIICIKNKTGTSERTDESAQNTTNKPCLKVTPGIEIGRGQIDVVDMQTECTSKYKYLFVYEDRASRFVVLKALHSNDAKEVALKLLDVISVVGFPTILQSGNGRTFVEQVIREMLSLWNGFNILSEDALQFPETERNFKDILNSWLVKNPEKTWLEGIKFIQVLENLTFLCQHSKVPYELLFRQNVYDRFKHIVHEVKNNVCLYEGEIKLEDNNKDNCTYSASDSDDNLDEGKSEEMSHCNSSGIQEADKCSKEIITASSCNFTSVKTESLHIKDSLLEEETGVSDVKEAKPERHSFKCKFCTKKYMKLGHLKNHLNSHKRARNFECMECSKRFRTERLYEAHVSICHKSKSKDGDCEEFNQTKLEAVSTERYSEISIHKYDTRAEKQESSYLNKVTGKSLRSAKRASIFISSSKIIKKRPKVNGAVLQCTYCEQKFDFPSVLKRHIRSHTNERPYVCKVCNKSFKQLGHLSQHSLTHVNYRSLQCPVCYINFESLNLLKVHLQSHPGQFTLKTRENYRLFECDDCKKVFTSKSVLERHIFTHTHERHFECSVCGKRFKQAGHVKSHMLVHTGERKFGCTVCSKRFSLSNSLKKHMYIHNGDKPYQCDVCGARFLEKRNLNGHLLTHTNERPFGCKVCGKRYTLADTLRRHISAAHEDGRTYQCEICAKMFKQLAHLSVHKKVHNDERPFQCHLCEKNFKHKNVLKSHLAIHANVRPFECDECKATFVRKTNLQTHIASAHMNERPYTCTICSKRFKQISHLNGHIVVHSNSMPYKCDYCDRRCNRLDNLKKHMRLHKKNTE